MELNKNRVFRLHGKVQHYAWGGYTYIPGLLNIPNADHKNFAEYWLGAHDNASSEMVIGDKRVKLNEYIKAFSQQALGTTVDNRFGRLPYLLKILDVKDMLSIQVHPTKENAIIEFANEQQKGIAIDAPHRNYKDDNHKPELMLALSDFWLLHGFKPAAALVKKLKAVPELNFLLPVFEEGGYPLLYKTVMDMEQSKVNAILQPLLDKIIPAYQENKLKKSDENFWAARAALTYNQPGKIDRGIFSIYLFNLLNMHAGEALFQDAGLPHAYMEGQNVEIMANSDNVLRGGLTPKHIDVDELLKHIKFEPTHPNIIHEKPVKKNISAFITPAPDFELGKIKLLKGESVSLSATSTDIFIVLEGALEVTENTENHFSLQSGDAWIALSGAGFSLEATADALVYSAGVPSVTSVE